MTEEEAWPDGGVLLHLVVECPKTLQWEQQGGLQGNETEMVVRLGDPSVSIDSTSKLSTRG